MKLKIKMIALTTVLLFSMTGQSFAASDPFTDISDTPSKDKIVKLYHDGVIKGAGNGLYQPDETLTAAQGVQMIVNAFDISLASFLFIKAPLATDWFKNAKRHRTSGRLGSECKMDQGRFYLLFDYGDGIPLSYAHGQYDVYRNCG
jgi:hypothetical protein